MISKINLEDFKRDFPNLTREQLTKKYNISPADSFRDVRKGLGFSNQRCGQQIATNRAIFTTEKLKTLYEKGLSYAEIAKECGGSRAGVSKGLDRLRNKGLIVLRITRHKYDEKTIEKIIDFHKSGKTAHQIAQEFNVKSESIKNILGKCRKKGLLPLYQQRKKHDREKILNLHLEGKTQAQIIQEMGNGLSLATVHKIFCEFRKKGRIPPIQRFSAIEKVLELKLNGQSKSQIAQALGISIGVIDTAIKNLRKSGLLPPWQPLPHRGTFTGFGDGI